MLNSRLLLLLYEPTQGLAPIIVEELLATLNRIVRDERLSALAVGQYAPKALAITGPAVAVGRGVVHAGASIDRLADPRRLYGYLGVAAALEA